VISASRPTNEVSWGGRLLVECPGRREVRLEPLDDQLVETLGVGQAPQVVRSQVAEGGAGGERVLDESPGGVGHDHLPAVGGVGDPGRPVHVDADVVVPAKGPFPGVDAHPDPERRAGGPVVGGEAPLGGGRRPDRPKRAAERDEEGVPVGADLNPAGLGDGSPDDRGVLVLDRRVPGTDPLEQTG
jgi:hypothetical protein